MLLLPLLYNSILLRTSLLSRLLLLLASLSPAEGEEAATLLSLLASIAMAA